MSGTNGCIGKCCAAFHLHGDNPAIVAAKDTSHANTILDMLKPLPAVTADEHWQMYTCRKWDRETTLCTIYDDRPDLCRTYPNSTQPCGWDGCTYPEGDG